MAVRGLVAPVEVRNLREVQAALRTASGRSEGQLRVVADDAAQMVTTRAARRVPVMTGQARRSLRPGQTPQGAKVVGGGRQAPHYPWLDFGGVLPGGQSRRFVDSGRFVFPAWMESRREVLDRLGVGLSRVVTDAGLVVS